MAVVNHLGQRVGADLYNITDDLHIIAALQHLEKARNGVLEIVITVARRALAQTINSQTAAREALEEEYGEVWDTDELRKLFVVENFAAPLVIVKRKSDGATGTLLFQHHPRLYFSFQAD